jgi:hypothetical protein
MPRSRKSRSPRRRQANRGSFKAGPDARRHVFTRQECWVGYAVCYIRRPELRKWLQRKVAVRRTAKSRTTAPLTHEADAMPI